MVSLDVFDNLGLFWAHLDTSVPFQTKINLLPHKDKVGFGGGAFEQKLIFVWNCSKGSKRAQKGPKWSKTSRLTILDPFGPLWTTLQCWHACLVWPFLFVLLVTPCIYMCTTAISANFGHFYHFCPNLSWHLKMNEVGIIIGQITWLYALFRHLDHFGPFLGHSGPQIPIQRSKREFSLKN